MPQFDLHAAMLAANLEDQLRIQQELTLSVLESAPRLTSAAPWVAAFRAERAAQWRWLRESLEHDLCPPWLVRMVLERWVYVPERVWDE